MDSGTFWIEKYRRLTSVGKAEEATTTNTIKKPLSTLHSGGNNSRSFDCMSLLAVMAA